jgi:Holliday junction resolvase RusA-like endonuclease
MTTDEIPVLEGQTDIYAALTSWSVRANGVPVPQGSKTAFRHSKTGRVVMLDANKNLADWRALVTARARSAWGVDRPPLEVPVVASVVFYLPRPKGHYGTGRNAGVLKPSAPLHPGVKPDLDKLVRSVFDSLTVAGVWRDDALCWGLSTYKNYADAVAPGVSLTLDWGTHE